MAHFRSPEVGHDRFAVRSKVDPKFKSCSPFSSRKNVSHRGTDVRLDHGVPFAAADYCRKSIDPTLWRWKVLRSHQWKRTGHIIQLEAIPVLDLVKRLLRNEVQVNTKCILLVDNQAVIGIATKRRTSSATLRANGTLRMAHQDGSPNVLRRMPKPKQVLSKRSKSERKVERKLLGALRSQVVLTKTESRYLQHVSLFLQFLQDHGKSYPRTFTSIDFELSGFIEHLWEESDPKTWASDVLGGLEHFIPSVKTHLLWLLTMAGRCGFAYPCFPYVCSVRGALRGQERRFQPLAR